MNPTDGTIALTGIYLNRSGVFNVRDAAFGAKGDGTTDDTQAIRAAVSAAYAAGGGVVLFPPGWYVTSSLISLMTGVTLQGMGDVSIIRASTQVDGFAFVVGQNVKDAVIRDLKFDGRASDRLLTQAQSGIHLNYSQDCRVENVTLINLGLTPWEVVPTDGRGGNYMTISTTEGEADASGNVVSNCRFIDSDGRAAFGIRVYTDWTINKTPEQYTSFTKDNVIRDCYFEGFNWNCVELVGPATMGNLLEGCRSNKHYGFSAFECDKGSRFNTLAHNLVYDLQPVASAQYGYRDQGATGGGGAWPDRFTSGNVFVGNQVRGITQVGNNTVGGILLSMSHDCTVIGLAVSGITASNPANANVGGVVIDGNPSASERANIQGCTIRDAQCGVYVMGILEGLVVMGCSFKVNMLAYKGTNANIKYITLMGNQVQGGTGGFQMGYETAYQLIGNIIRDTSSVSLFLALNTTGAAIGNTVLNPGNYGIQAKGSGQVVVGNRTTGTIHLEDVLRSGMIGNQGDVNDNGSGIITYGSAAPVSGTWVRGDIVLHPEPVAGGYLGWVCTLGGTPGTWKQFGQISA